MAGAFSRLVGWLVRFDHLLRTEALVGTARTEWLSGSVLPPLAVTFCYGAVDGCERKAWFASIFCMALHWVVYMPWSCGTKRAQLVS